MYFLCCAHISHEGNQYYNCYDCDLFDLLESDLELYSGFAKVGVIGDLNTRLGLLVDIIRNDGPSNVNRQHGIIVFVPAWRPIY